VRIAEKIGAGGMATVYKGYQDSLERHVAVKVPLRDAQSEKAWRRFRKEGRSIAKLRHPNIVQVYDFAYDQEQGIYYMVMEFIDGPSLKVRLEELVQHNERMPLKEAARIVSAVAEALDYAHQRGMVHRDVKPANILLTKEESKPLLADFGLVKDLKDPEKLTKTGAMGSFTYMAPEQMRGEVIDPRADIYALGTVLYEMVTRRLPFEPVFKKLQEPPPPPRKFSPSLPIELEKVILKAIATRPEERYQSAQEMIKALRSVVS